MKRILTISAFLVGTTQLFCQNGKLVDGDRYKGAIFPATYQMPYPEELRFTPTVAEIARFEQQLKAEIKGINNNKPNQGRHYGPIIHRNLKKYVRQYIGFVTAEGERVIHVNFLWNHLNPVERIKGYTLWAENFQEDWLNVYDGGSRYWQIKFNLTTSEFIDFWVNGIS